MTAEKYISFVWMDEANRVRWVKVDRKGFCYAYEVYVMDQQVVASPMIGHGLASYVYENTNYGDWPLMEPKGMRKVEFPRWFANAVGARLCKTREEFEEGIETAMREYGNERAD